MAHERAAAEAEAEYPDLTLETGWRGDHEQVRFHNERQAFIKGYLSALSAKEDEVRELQKLQWVLVQDRIPEHLKLVDVYSKGYDPDNAHVAYLHPHKGWIDPDFGEDDPIESAVTHWRERNIPPQP